ncbi:hypothetical protein SAMN05444339_10614 [Loktanella atrilutea]|uniref:Twin-arginine translocation pathway signal n=1 Tax=Loktanella atrilutea TaxID=366533 RepID=A0A1M5BHB8_LOKAT|nr:DUF1513 domain-containing protein [Loktanella atrilutea]SHF41855.1 hypothetical protein SAMN05444339_10614 [Loktanella atrilutea]
MTTRRAFLGSLLAAGALPRLSWADAGSPAFLAAAQEPDGGFAVFGLSAAGIETFRVPLPARGHAGAAHPSAPEVVAFARRPGTYALVINAASGAVTRRLAAEDGREFNGHGVFSEDGTLLYTSEVVAESGEGRIGVWSRDDGYARVGEFASGGIGPHEVIRLPGTETLVVANGGIQTGPGDREKLNLDTMAPNLTYLTTDGDVVQRVALATELHHASIRHLAVNDAGRVAFAMQWEGDVTSAPALLGLHDLGDDAARLVQAGPEAHAAMQGYAGSVAFFDGGTRVAISSPKGGRAQVFDAEGAFLYEIARADVCGLAGVGDTLLLTDGFGTVLGMQGETPAWHTRFRRAWDNHVVKV